MDIDKLYKRVMSDTKLKNIPQIFVFKVLFSVLEAIGSGECFVETEVEAWDM